MLGVFKGWRREPKRPVVELPLRRRQSPGQPDEVASVTRVTLTAALGSEIKQIPPLVFLLWWRRYRLGLLAGDRVAAYSDEALAALRPEGGKDAGGPSAPAYEQLTNLFAKKRAYALMM